MQIIRNNHTSLAVCNPTPTFRPIIDLSNNLSPINAKLTSLSYVHASKYICFLANVHRYHSNNSYGELRLGNSSH